MHFASVALNIYFLTLLYAGAWQSLAKGV
jgi:hypothetical protein